MEKIRRGLAFGAWHSKRPSIAEFILRARGSECPAVSAERRDESTQGWTLIELLIVISIVMILAAMSLTSYRNSVQLAKEAALASDLFMMREAIDQYYADKGKYPEALQNLVSDNYIRAVPKDPMTNSTDSWQTVEAEPQPGAANNTEPGVYDVKSGAQGTATDGRNYSDF
jgi:general secretion pathway protein G